MANRERSSIPIRETANVLVDVFSYRPTLGIAILSFSLLAAVLEGIGISFVLPIMHFLGEGEETSGVLTLFESAYAFVGVPFTFETVVVGVSLVLVVRFSANIVVAWLREKFRANYKRHLQEETFEKALHARMAVFDREGTDEVLNTIVTQSDYASQLIYRVVRLFQLLSLSIIYVVIAFYFAPILTVIAGLVMGVLGLFIRLVIEPGYAVGEGVADANERIQSVSQAGMQGIRDVKIFNLQSEFFETLSAATEDYVREAIKVNLNRAIIKNLYQMVTAIALFVLVYAAVRVADMSLGAIGVFLLALFRLAPRISILQDQLYQTQTDLPHFVRTRAFLEGLDDAVEGAEGTVPLSSPISTIEFRDVSFAYGDEPVLRDVSFQASLDEQIAFVGKSGGGKSTILALLARFYDPAGGAILANGEPIDSFDVDEWRSRIAFVPQSPYIFNDTLRYNLTVGKRDATESEIRWACEIARVDEFIEDLADGFDTMLGEDGAQLSGGQRQRIAIARALLKDADVLLLDEATSDVDAHLQEDIQREIEGVDENYILIAISHRLSTVRNADCIYIVENGQIVEQGTHDVLLEANGKYSDLYETQVEQ